MVRVAGMRKCVPVTVILSAALLLSACGSTSDSTPGGPDSGTPDASACRVTVNADITTPTVLQNGPEECDYYFAVSQQYDVTEPLSIEPGTVLRFAEGSTLMVTDSGSLHAVGEPDQRIVFEGAEAVPGYWVGICFGNNSESRLEYVDLLAAGRITDYASSSCTGAIGGIHTASGSKEPVHLLNVRQYGSLANGLSAHSMRLGEFSNNAFAGNAAYGVSVQADQVQALDPASDYLGSSLGEPNVQPFVHVDGWISGEQEHHWYPLGVPYRVEGFTPGYSFSLFIDGGAKLTLHPGVHIYFDRGTGLNVWDDAVLSAVGTMQQPVVLTGVEESPGSWNGVSVMNAGLNLNNLHLSWGGSAEAGNSAGIHIYGDELDSLPKVLNTVSIQGSATCGIWISEHSFPLVQAQNVDVTGNHEDLCLPDQYQP